MELAEVNTSIVVLEDQSTEEHRKRLEGRLEQRRAELAAHDEAKPAEVKAPAQDPEDDAETTVRKHELTELVKRTEELDRQILDARQSLRDAALKIAAAERLLARIDNFQRQLQTFYTESIEDGKILGLDIKTLINLTVNRQPISEIKANAEERSHEQTVAVASDAPGSLVHQRREI